MIYISYDKVGRSEVYYNVPGKDKLQDTNIDEVKGSLREHLSQLNMITGKLK